MINKKQLIDYILNYIKENNVSIEKIPSMIDELQLELLRVLSIKENKIYVLKKSGEIQQFDIEKLKYSIVNASDEIEQPLNSSDANYIVNKIIEKFKNDGINIIKTINIRSMVIKELVNIGYSEVAHCYEKYYRIK